MLSDVRGSAGVESGSELVPENDLRDVSKHVGDKRTRETLCCGAISLLRAI